MRTCMRSPHASSPSHTLVVNPHTHHTPTCAVAAGGQRAVRPLPLIRCRHQRPGWAPARAGQPGGAAVAGPDGAEGEEGVLVRTKDHIELPAGSALQVWDVAHPASKLLIGWCQLVE